MSKSNLGVFGSSANQQGHGQPGAAYVPRDGSISIATQVASSMGESSESLSDFLQMLTSAKDRYLANVGKVDFKIFIDKLSGVFPVDVPFMALLMDETLYVHTFALNKAWAHANLYEYTTNIPWDYFKGRFGERTKNGDEQIVTPVTPVRLASEDGIEDDINSMLSQRGDVPEKTTVIFAGCSSIPYRFKIVEDDATIFAAAFSMLRYQQGLVNDLFEFNSWSDLRKSPFESTISFQDGNVVDDMIGNRYAAQFKLTLNQRPSSNEGNGTKYSARLAETAINMGALYGDMDCVYIPVAERAEIIENDAKQGNGKAPKYDMQLSYKAMLVIRHAARPAGSTSLVNFLIQLAATVLLDQNFLWWDAFSFINAGSANSRIEPGYGLGTIGFETNPMRDYEKKNPKEIEAVESLNQYIDCSHGAMSRTQWEALMSRMFLHSVGVALAIPMDGEPSVTFSAFDGSWAGYNHIIKAAIDATNGKFLHYFTPKSHIADVVGDDVIENTIRYQLTGTYARQKGAEVIDAPLSEQLKYLAVLDQLKGDEEAMYDYSSLVDGTEQDPSIVCAAQREYLNSRLKEWTEVGTEKIQRLSSKFLAALYMGLRDNKRVDNDGNESGRGITFFSDKQGYVPSTREQRRSAIKFDDTNMFTGTRDINANGSAAHYTATGYVGNRRKW